MGFRPDSSDERGCLCALAGESDEPVRSDAPFVLHALRQTSDDELVYIPGPRVLALGELQAAFEALDENTRCWVASVAARASWHSDGRGLPLSVSTNFDNLHKTIKRYEVDALVLRRASKRFLATPSPALQGAISLAVLPEVMRSALLALADEDVVRLVLDPILNAEDVMGGADHFVSETGDEESHIFYPSLDALRLFLQEHGPSSTQGPSGAIHQGLRVHISKMLAPHLMTPFLSDYEPSTIERELITLPFSFTLLSLVHAWAGAGQIELLRQICGEKVPLLGSTDYLDQAWRVACARQLLNTEEVTELAKEMIRLDIELPPSAFLHLITQGEAQRAMPLEWRCGLAVARDQTE